ncbi:MAG: radical SAM protein [Candidatus Ancaeobacter aquaticus]|nr:radical SAM protein [Candidatus Ancaeobacter aquaticus]
MLWWKEYQCCAEEKLKKRIENMVTVFDKIKSVLIKPFVKSENLSMLIFFITSRCNQKCKSCFIWQRKDNAKADLSISEIESVSKKAPLIDVLLLSGGEPFMREDIVDIIRLFFENNGIKNLAIPTNGSLTDISCSKIKEIASISSGLSVSVNFSIDGTMDIHDSIRGVSGAFKQTVLTLESVLALKKEYHNISVVVNTVIMSDNLENISSLMSFIDDKGYDLDHVFEIVRGKPQSPDMLHMDQRLLKEVYADVLLYQEKRLKEKYCRHDFKWIIDSFIARICLANLSVFYRKQLDIYFKQKSWGFPCQAGNSISVLYSNGDMPLCELRDSGIMNIRDNDYDMKKILQSENFVDLRKKIRHEKCSCTHICFLMESAYKSVSFLFFQYPVTFLKMLFKARI